MSFFSGDFQNGLAGNACNFFAVYVKSELVHCYPPPLFLFYCAEFACLKALAALDALGLVDDMFFFDAAADRANRTFSGTGGTSLTSVCNGVVNKGFAGTGSTFVIVDVIFVLVPEISQCGKYRVRGGLSKSAQ